MYQHIDFVGPLDAAAQAWCDRVAEADRAAASTLPLSAIVARREASIAELHRSAALLLVTGDDHAALTVTLGAVAETRALAGLLASDRDADCIDCLVYGPACTRHAPGSGHEQPSWHRFGR